MVTSSRPINQIIIRRARSALLRTARYMASIWRIFCIRISNDGVTIPWSTRIDRGVDIRVTDEGNLLLGRNIAIGPGVTIVVQAGVISIGDACSIGRGCVLVATVHLSIGRQTLIAECVTIRDQDHQIDRDVEIVDSGFVMAPISIGDDVWIGAKATVLRGSSIGSRAVIGAHALVRGPIPESAVAVGIPAKVIRQRLIANAR